MIKEGAKIKVFVKNKWHDLTVLKITKVNNGKGEEDIIETRIGTFNYDNLLKENYIRLPSSYVKIATRTIKLF
jgi:hypothetical protein